MKQKISDSDLKKGIEEGKVIAMNCFTLTDSFVKNLEIVVNAILEFYKKKDLLPSIFSSVQELINWTSLTNKRYIYYKQNHIELTDQDAFLEIETKFLATINQTNAESYRNTIIENKMYIHTTFEHNEESLIIKVYNYSDNVVNQEDYLRNYLSDAMNYKNVLEYFETHAEDPHGKNLGLAFSIIILKEAGLRPELMRINNLGTRGSFSKIEIPFHSAYLSLRDKILNDEKIVPFERKTLVPEKFQKELDERIRRMFPEVVELYESEI